MGLPWIKAAVCFLHKEGKTLFLDYRDYPHKIHEGNYSVPGGKYEAEKDKTTMDTAVRETVEEVSILARNLIYRGTVHFNNEERTVLGKPMKINVSVDIYDSYDFDDSNARATEEKDGRFAKLEWIADSHIDNIKELHAGDRKMFEWLRLYKEFEGTIAQRGTDLLYATLSSHN